MNGLFPTLEALLAFSLTMLVLATAVSAIVGVVLRLMRSRARNLRKMVLAFFKVEIKKGEERDFLGEMTLVPNAMKPTEAANKMATLQLPDIGRYPSWTLWKDLGRTLDTLPPEEFRRRLESSGAGKQVLEDAASGGTNEEEKAKLRTAKLDALTAAFEAYGAATAESFARRVRPWNVVAAFALVWALQVDALEIVASYLRNPEVATQAIVAAQRNLEADAEKLEDLRGSGLDKEAISLVEDASREAKETRARVDALLAGLPIGIGAYPWCTAVEPAKDIRCGDHWRGPDGPWKDIDKKGVLPQFWRWVWGYVLTALMVGLGTSVWLEIVNSLLRGRELIRGGKKAVEDHAT